MNSYRCYYTPLDSDHRPVLSETGVLPYIDVRAGNAEQAQRAAHKKLHAPIAQVERREGGAR
jgi:hypothetical protein